MLLLEVVELGQLEGAVFFDVTTERAKDLGVQLVFSVAFEAPEMLLVLRRRGIHGLMGHRSKFKEIPCKL